MSKYFVTTPIYYVNDIPHIGHAYTTIAADILARYHRIRGHDVFFLTGTDEHGQKVEEAAARRGLTPKAHADGMVENFCSLWKKLEISNDAFIRTTDEPHVKTVQGLLQSLWEKGEIEKRAWRGWYCTPDERFWTEKDLVDGNCPDCGRPVHEVEEENYFFLMSKYHDRLVEHIEANPGFILPESRRNEVLGFLRSRALGDLCITRPKSRLSWGITVPFDEAFVTYVWFDALVNYFSATGYLAPPTHPEGFWPADHHLVGKDILTTHAVYWSTMLMALDMPLPRTLFAHGWWTVDGRKMSKSLGNVVDPGAVADKFGIDAFRYFLFREVPFGLDGDFSVSAMTGRINSDLANDLGNLASRALNMIVRYRDGVVPAPAAETQREEHIGRVAEALPARLSESLAAPRFQRALEDVWELVSLGNKYIEDTAPWALAKNPADADRLNTVLYTTAETLRVLAVTLWPFMPGSMQTLWERLGQAGNISAMRNFDEEVKWGRLAPGTKVFKGDALFPRIDMEIVNEQTAPKDSVASAAPESTQEKAPVAPPENVVTIDEFARVQLKTGKIIEAERVPKSNKLLRLQVDTGEMRQVVAGIAKWYAPEDIIGKTVVIVCNLAPAKLMGVESQGMILAASDAAGNLAVISPERPIAPGNRVK